MKCQNAFIKHSINLFIFFLSVSILIISCKSEIDKKRGYSLETAKMVSQAPPAIIASDQNITVIFVADMVKKSQVGVNLKKDVFSFSPSIDGITVWQDQRTLIFNPNENLSLRSKYTGTLNLNALFPEYKDKNLEDLPIAFEVAGREIEKFDSDLKLKMENDPKFLFLEGKVTFTEPVDFSRVEKSSSLYLENKRLVIKWSEGENKKQYNFITDAFARTKESQSLKFKIKKELLEISYDMEKTIKIPSLIDLTVTDIIRGEEGTQPDLKIEFSDELNNEQDIRGFISIKPDLDIKLNKMGNTILVSAAFDFGETYTLTIKPGIRSRWATTLTKEFSEEIQFDDMLPEMKFTNAGVFLPSNNKKKIAFLTVNVRKVKLTVQKVFESNLGQFLQMESLDGSADRRDEFSYQINRVGIEVAKQDLNIGEKKNEWLQHEIDLHRLIPEGEKGLFLIEIGFNREDMIYDTSEENMRYRRRGRGDYDYYNDPSSGGYIWRHGRIYKPIIISDIGLIYKKGSSEHHVYATNLLNTAPLSGVHVRLITYQHQLIAENYTDGEGIAVFPNIKENVFYVEAEKDGQRSVVTPNEMGWNLSTFDTGGDAEAETGVRAFIYADRGVHRPGDTVYLSAIVRNEDDTFPKDHPVSLEVKNPKNQIIFQQTNRKGTDGFYTFHVTTDANDLTGNYTAILTAGSKKFYHTLHIETVVPERLKINLETPKQNLFYTDKTLEVKMNSIYLFGNPAASLDAEITVSLSSVEKSFKKYSDYIFSDQTSRFERITSSIFKGQLDAQGNVTRHWTLPDFSNVPGAIRAIIKGEVWEKGGRSSKNQISVNIDPYPNYVGIKRPKVKWGYLQTGQEYEAPVILLSPEGREVAGRTLQYRIYRSRYYWWWEYDSRDEYRLRYKKDRNTQIVDKGTIVSGTTPVLLKFKPEERGEYLIEVQENGKGGHTAAFFIHAYAWGQSPAMGKDAGILAIKTDKEKYNPGDKAIISFPTPQNSTILFTIEQGNKVFESKWYESGKEEYEKSIEILVTKEMLPNVYASVAVIQAHDQTANDRPIRMYGIVPINVEEASTHQELQIKMPDELNPEKEFEVEIQTSDKRETQLTVAVVDEGLLSLTQFKTPDPWKAFFKKQRLGVTTYDLFSHVIGVNKGDIFKTFSIGGGLAEAEDYREDQLDQQKAKRFKAVVMFEGPVMTDSKGRVKVKFKMPNYIGAVRVMVVCANKNQYGHAEKIVPVKTDLMVMPTLPRIIGPNDKIKLPVTVFALIDNIGDVQIHLQLEGPLTNIGEITRQLSFTKAGEHDVQFDVVAKAAVGVAKVKIEAISSKMTAKYETEISVRSSSPRISETLSETVEKGDQIKITVPNKGLEGSNRAIISIQRRPNLKLTRRLYWLIRYPYGCIEQTVSSVFPQLYLPEFIPNEWGAKRDISRNINAAIDRLKRFQLSSGGFAYWPGGRDASEWGTSYAGHFLIEAKKLGYNVPDDMYNNWLRFQKAKVSRSKYSIMAQVYLNYTLALAGESRIGGMNLLRENEFKKMSDTHKWLLAAGYQLSGAQSAAAQVLAAAGLNVTEYQEFANTYGSTLRDKSIILEQLIIFERWNEANKLAEEIATVLSSNTWYSTQTTAFMLMALGKYFKAIEAEEGEKPNMVGTIILPNGKEIDFETGDINYQIDIEEDFGKEVQVRLDNKSTVKRAFAIVDWSGLPLEYLGEDEEQNLKLSVEWLDEDGMKIDPTDVRQGQTFWGHFRVNKLPGYRSNIEEIALVQILPSGWEIDNTRLSGEARSAWMRKWQIGREEYLDIRDDRIMWFFDLPAYGDGYDFVVKINTVTAGEFTLPPTLVEAMYNNSYRAIKAGKKIIVRER